MQSPKNTFDKSNNILDRKLTINQLISIDIEELFTIGGHSHKHKIFSMFFFYYI